MLPPRSVTQEGLDFTAGWEGWVPFVYQDIVNVTTWGFGHARKGGEPLPSHPLTKPEGFALLLSDMTEHVKPIDVLLALEDLTFNQFNMIADWLFNCGPGALKGSGVLAAILRGDMSAVPAELAKWCRVTQNGQKVQNQGLLNRRHAEGLIFLKADAVVPISLCTGMGDCPSYRTHQIVPPDEEILARGWVILSDLAGQAMQEDRENSRPKD